MPWIIDYEMVLDQMRRQRMKSLYPNSGAFGFLDTASVRQRGWLGPPDVTLRPEAVQAARQVIEPHESNLAKLLVQAWRDVIGGKVWIMPMSHWAYELDYGSREWMPAVLEHAGLDPGLLETRSDAAAIEFSLTEAGHVQHLVQRLIEMLFGSDFAVAFPGTPLLCTIDHHQQVWWSSTDAALIDRLDAAAEASGLLLAADGDAPAGDAADPRP